MKFNYPYLKDKTFLKELDLSILKELFIKINVLDWNERPIAAIEGRSTGGTINLDGKSSVRRTASVNMIADDTINDITSTKNLISINKKVAIELGLLNTTFEYSDYPIVWFPQGTFVVNQASISKNNSGLNISMSLKDKMCLLNGDCGGTFAATVEFHLMDSIDRVTGETIQERPTIYTIIQRVVHEFGGESLDRIIINDIDNRIKKVMKWVGDTPVYLNESKTEDNLSIGRLFLTPSSASTLYEYGQDLGYIYSDFYYPSDLIANAGESVVSVLDKIKNALGNFEYFYDLEGNFIFQEIKNYLNTSYPTTIEELAQSGYEVDLTNGKSVYQFTDSQLVTSYSNQPQYNAIKNDFVIWGVRKGVTGAEIPIRYHLAIDQKPQIGKTYTVYIDRNIEGMEGLTVARWIIAVDNFASISSPVAGTVYGIQDEKGNFISCQLYDKGTFTPVSSTNVKNIEVKDWRTELYLSGVQAIAEQRAANYYYAELATEWPKLYDIVKGAFYKKSFSEIDFFLDFIDTGSAYQEFNIQAIGRRTKTINDKTINCITAPAIPDYILIKTGQADTAQLREEAQSNGDNYIQVNPTLYDSIVASESTNAAYDNIKMMLHEYTSYNESVSIVTMPIYYLEPNTRITIEDHDTGIHGDYMINSFSIPLTYNGTMTLQCKKAIERI